MDLEPEVLVGWIGALEAGQELGGEQPQAAHESLLRVARAIRKSPHAPEIEGLVPAAAALERASREDVAARVSDLLQLLRDANRQMQAVTTNILVVDDDPLMQRIAKISLDSPGRKILFASSAEHAREILHAWRISLVILDLVLPDADGRNFLIELREDSTTASIPVFVLSAQHGSLAQTECFALGAEAVFEKPFDIKVLGSSVSAALYRSALARHHRRCDMLTGLPNRAAFIEEYRRAAMLADRQKAPLSVAMLDLDKFRDVNEKYGQTVGDRVLKRVAQSLRDSLRGSDLVARWGGEEFVVLLPNTDRHGARSALTKTAEAVRALKVPLRGTDTVQVSISVGVTQVAPTTSPDSAVAEAGRHLYSAKAAGGDQIKMDEEPARHGPVHVLLAEDDKRSAEMIRQHLEKDGLTLHHTTDGREALELSRKQPMDLFIVDVLLPGIDGFELIRQLRKDMHSRRAPVVILISQGDEQNLTRAFELGADEYLVKPVTGAEVVGRLRRLLR